MTHEVVAPLDAARDLERRATRIRMRDLRMVYEAGLGHPGGEFSAIDILTFSAASLPLPRPTIG